MLRRVGLVRTDVLEKHVASIIRVAYSCHPDERDDMLLRNVGSYKTHTA
jgi:hypothetical protein